MEICKHTQEHVRMYVVASVNRLIGHLVRRGVTLDACKHEADCAFSGI